MCCSARRPTTWVSTASRWPATRNSGRTIFCVLLDGPRAAERDLIATAKRVADGGLFGYRFYYPPMRVGRHGVFWHRPLVAYLSHETGLPAVLEDAPLGYLTAYRVDKPDLDRPVELWPRLLDREPHRLAVEGFHRDHDARYHRTAINLRKIFETRDLMDSGPLEPAFARSLLTAAKHESLDDWLKSIPDRACTPQVGERMTALLQEAIDIDAAADGAAAKSRPATRPVRSLSYARTAKRSYEKAYWNLIAELATGQYINKDNADCVHRSRRRKPRSSIRSAISKRWASICWTITPISFGARICRRAAC